MQVVSTHPVVCGCDEYQVFRVKTRFIVQLFFVKQYNGFSDCKRLRVWDLARPAVLKCPRWIEDNELGLHQNCIFQTYLGQLFMADSTCFRPQHNENKLVKHSPGVSQVQAGLKCRGACSDTSWVAQAFAVYVVHNYTENFWNSQMETQNNGLYGLWWLLYIYSTSMQIFFELTMIRFWVQEWHVQ